ncbi:UNVERIFIED_CONTAM: hypothetical protein Scaly_1046300 [Sesamum calycinum]|uniref:DUF4283 domain-containing protein n=1 Tax=Sesamum calycinum TaxID=2727403 RepID=A0AAW2QKW9_9LAMI
MHKAKKTKQLAQAVARLESGQPFNSASFFVKALAITQPVIAPASIKENAKPTNLTKEALPAKEDTIEAGGMAKSTFVGLFSSNRKLIDENKLTKFAIELETLKLWADDLIDIRTKLGYCLVGYIAGKFLGLQAIRALSKSWGASFQQHGSGWLIFRFTRDDDMQRILANGLYFVYGHPLLKTMPDCFEFKEDDISLTMVWATLLSLLLECWHPSPLGKIGSRLGMLIAMDSLTMKMERVLYALILVEVDASKPLVNQVDFMLPNGVMRKQQVVYEFTPKFRTDYNRFGHLNGSCQGTQPPTAGATMPSVSATIIVSTNLEKGQPAEWTVVKRRHQKHHQKNQHLNCPMANKDDHSGGLGYLSACFGQEINFLKSSVSFSHNTPWEVRSQLAADLHIRVENRMELYLSLPLKVARSKKDIFVTIKDRIWGKISGWNEKFLSQAGKEILIMSVRQAIASYAMGCFWLPTTLLSEIQGLIA